MALLNNHTCSREGEIATALPPGRPVTGTHEVASPEYVTSWGHVVLVAPLVVAFFVITACLAIPPLVSYRDAWRQTRELFFGDAAFPWQR